MELAETIRLKRIFLSQCVKSERVIDLMQKAGSACEDDLIKYLPSDSSILDNVVNQIGKFNRKMFCLFIESRYDSCLENLFNDKLYARREQVHERTIRLWNN